jgi:hypothetical protein
MRLRRTIAIALGCGSMLASSPAWADRIAVLPSRGVDAAARTQLDGELARGLAALGHTLVTAPDVAAAIAAHVPDGAADTLEEYRAVGSATRADWVLVGAVEPAVTTSRVELTACLVKLGRVEAVARELERAKEQPQLDEMLAVLMRPEGIGAGALPWERAPVAPPPPRVAPPPAPPPVPPTPPPPPPAVPPIDGRARVEYPAGESGDVWPPYSGGKRGFVAATVGFGLPAARPAPPAGVSTSSGAAFVGAVRAGYAVGDLGFEPFAELGGNLFGPRALWLDVGARWMFAPAMHRGPDGVLGGVPFFLGPEVFAGGLIELPTGSGAFSTPAAGRGMLGAALDAAFAISRSVSLEARLGDLRWSPGGSGAILLAGAELGLSVRF